MSERMPVEQWPAAQFVAEELQARGTPLQSFLDVTGIKRKRWDDLVNGKHGLLLSETQKIAGALDVSMELIANLNLSYMRWNRGRSRKS